MSLFVSHVWFSIRCKIHNSKTANQFTVIQKLFIFWAFHLPFAYWVTFSLTVSVRNCGLKATRQDITHKCKGHFSNPAPAMLWRHNRSYIVNIMPPPQTLQHVSHWLPLAGFPARWGVKKEQTADCYNSHLALSHPPSLLQYWPTEC